MDTTTNNEQPGAKLPYQWLGILPFQISDMGVVEAKRRIRETKAHDHFGLPAPVLAQMSADETRVWLATGDKPARFANGMIPSPVSNPRAIEDLRGALSGLFDTSEIEAKIMVLIAEATEKLERYISQVTPVKYVVEVQRPDQPVRTITGIQHRKLPLILKLLAIPEINVALVGPAGSGKSRVAFEAAKALDLQCSPVSFNILSSKADVLGFVDASGAYHASAFRERFEQGGLFIADEFDAAHAGVATILNAAIANRICTFGDNKTVQAHDSFRFVACMNTYGTGATAEYVGRNRLDAATLDRFVFVTMEYDDALERTLCGIETSNPPIDLEPRTAPSASDWLSIIRRAREITKRENIRAIISPRASIMGCKLASAGIGRKHLLEMLIYRGLPDTDRAKLAAGIN